MAQRIAQVDAFADRPFSGNPAGVCVLERDPGDTWMQQVAAEMNCAETAFLRPVAGGFHIRWFTPAIEVDLCGHATLASAHLLWEEGHVAPGREIRFDSRSGVLTARPDAEGWIILDFPAEPARPTSPPANLVSMLGLPAGTPILWVGQSRFDLLVEVGSRELVRQARPDFATLRPLPYRGVILTAAGGPVDRTAPESDFVSRFFAPAVGIDEDPVTGSAHCTLALHWAARLGRPSLTGFQASARGGVVRVEVRGQRVLLGGRAVTVLRGELTV